MPDDDHGAAIPLGGLVLLLRLESPPSVPVLSLPASGFLSPFFSFSAPFLFVSHTRGSKISGPGAAALRVLPSLRPSKICCVARNRDILYIDFLRCMKWIIPGQEKS